MSDSHYDIACEELARYGIKPRIHSQNKHLKLRFEYGGRKLQVSMAVSPSDQRAHHRVRSTIRRLLRAP
jgi:hypothetical protein